MMNIETTAKVGRIYLWFLVVIMLGTGVRWRYFASHEWHVQMVQMLGGDYALQLERLATVPVAEGLHRVMGVLLLIAGMLQFHPGLRRSRPALHRWSGRLFLLLAWVMAATAIYLSLTVAYTGPAFNMFTLPTALVLIFMSLKAYSHARAKRFALHREWMIRTLALCFFIATMRLVNTTFVVLTDWPDRAIFDHANWIGVFINLTVAEWWINVTRNARAPAAV